MSTAQHPLMPKATAVWLVDNTSLSFEQIAEFCGMHMLEVKGIADGDVAAGIRGKNPVSAGELTREEISKAEKNPEYRLKVATSKVKIPEIKQKKRPRYTPVSRRQDRPNAVLWLLRNHSELKDSQIMRLVGTTKPTIQQIRDRTHWNSANLVPQDPVTLGLCSQVDLDAEVAKAASRVAKERAALGLPPIEADETLLPASETTSYQPGGMSEEQTREEAAPTAENVFGAAPPADQSGDSEADSEAEEAARVFAKLQGLSSQGDRKKVDDEDAENADEAEAEADDTETR